MDEEEMEGYKELDSVNVSKEEYEDLLKKYDKLDEEFDDLLKECEFVINTEKDE